MIILLNGSGVCFICARLCFWLHRFDPVPVSTHHTHLSALAIVVQQSSVQHAFTARINAAAEQRGDNGRQQQKNTGQLKPGPKQTETRIACIHGARSLFKLTALGVFISWDIFVVLERPKQRQREPCNVSIQTARLIRCARERVRLHREASVNELRSKNRGKQLPLWVGSIHTY